MGTIPAYPVTPTTLLEGNGPALSSNAAPATAITARHKQPRDDVWINKTRIDQRLRGVTWHSSRRSGWGSSSWPTRTSPSMTESHPVAYKILGRHLPTTKTERRRPLYKDSFIPLVLVTLMSTQAVEAADKPPPAKDTVVM